ncbi:polysaccharide deacetylase family protein [Flavobacterium terrisoli]|uniref:polysaccharide deacetylase family protein n=1 Tax=Flavobacterium terrisoli TaxID=3242195 RepID=UPI002543DB07|nr:polysaccharide deacetylase family protein [Flavobacterium buctense]
MENGKFVISLDFELLWGVRDKKTIESYGENIKGVHQVIPKLLSLFDQYKIKATFSTVGFLFFETKEQLIHNVPKNVPNYQDKNLSPYNGHFEKVGHNHEVDPYHFAPSLIKLIKDHPEQEIGTHTYSHYYCLEEGQTVDDFRSDIEKAIWVAQKEGIDTTSLIFPRNQFNNDYLNVCKDLGIICYRGNERSWLYAAKNSKKESLFRRAFRLIDVYINLSGNNCYSEASMKGKIPVDIPSTRLLRAYSKKTAFLDALKLRRIKSGMTYAAKNNLTYHLWWHPHNFGINQEENFAFLEKILKYYQHLNATYNFESITMTNLAKRIIQDV